MHYAVLCNAAALLCITGVKWINVQELSDILGEHSSADDHAFNHSILKIYLELHFGEYLVEIKTSKMTSEDTQTKYDCKVYRLPHRTRCRLHR